jgi:sensor domain CHASE-containing protein
MAAFNVALGERKSQLDVFVYRVQGLAESFSHDETPNPSEFEQTARAALLVADAYRRISGHAFAINILTDNRDITARVNRIQQEISAGD